MVLFYGMLEEMTPLFRGGGIYIRGSREEVGTHLLGGRSVAPHLCGDRGSGDTPTWRGVGEVATDLRQGGMVVKHLFRREGK